MIVLYHKLVRFELISEFLKDLETKEKYVFKWN